MAAEPGRISKLEVRQGYAGECKRTSKGRWIEEEQA